jgi:hypothetical protein
VKAGSPRWYTVQELAMPPKEEFYERTLHNLMGPDLGFKSPCGNAEKTFV